MRKGEEKEKRGRPLTQLGVEGREDGGRGKKGTGERGRQDGHGREGKKRKGMKRRREWKYDKQSG